MAQWGTGVPVPVPMPMSMSLPLPSEWADQWARGQGRLDTLPTPAPPQPPPHRPSEGVSLNAGTTVATPAAAAAASSAASAAGKEKSHTEGRTAKSARASPVPRANSSPDSEDTYTDSWLTGLPWASSSPPNADGLEVSHVALRVVSIHNVDGFSDLYRSICRVLKATSWRKNAPTTQMFETDCIARFDSGGGAGIPGAIGRSP